ncbi:MAG: neutral zinc metallopeptidase [Actinoplanes sp.]
MTGMGHIRVDHAARRMVRGLAVVLLLVSSGCGVVSGTPDGARSAAPSSAAPETSVSDLVLKSLKDVERFWSQTYPAISDGAAFEPVKGGFHPYTRSTPPPACGDQPTEYEPNAFYCPAGDFIAWDAEALIPQLQASYGPLLVGVVMAHEYGHAVQARLALAGQPTVVVEQQADCYAGAWTADVLAGRSIAFTGVTAPQLDNTVGGLLMLRDQPGTSAQAPQAHGNAFDRIRALQEGVESGAKKCVTYRAGNLPVTEVSFTSQEDAASGGNLPYDDAVNGLSADAQAYWKRTYPRLTDQPWRPLRVEPFDTSAPPPCAAPDASAGGSAFFCPEGDFIAFDNEQLGPALYENIGDNAVGTMLGDLFARAAQGRRGASTRDRPGQLTVDCLTGSWTYDLLHRTNPAAGLTLSPGDLDEAVAAMLAFGRATEQQGVSAFDRIAAYRNGVLQGLPACN